MKKIIPVTLLMLMIAGLWGCGLLGGSGEDSVTFYYQRPAAEFSYGQEDGVIAAEKREISGRRDNLQYLLTLYLRGPQDPALVSPFPSGTALAELQTEDSTLVITLNSTFAQLKDIDLTIACTCLAKTCFEISDTQQVRIEAGQDDSAVSVTIGRDNYLLTDRVPETTPTE